MYVFGCLLKIGNRVKIGGPLYYSQISITERLLQLGSQYRVTTVARLTLG